MSQHTKRLLDDCDTVLGIVRRNGECDATDFIDHIERKFQARYQRWFEYLRDGNRIKNPENLKHLRTTTKGVVWELKGDAYRLYMIEYEGVWYVAHGVRKLKDKQVNAEIEKALDLFADLIL
jgi:hypothetical protein